MADMPYHKGKGRKPLLSVVEDDPLVIHENGEAKYNPNARTSDGRPITLLIAERTFSNSIRNGLAVDPAEAAKLRRLAHKIAKREALGLPPKGKVRETRATKQKPKAFNAWGKGIDPLQGKRITAPILNAGTKAGPIKYCPREEPRKQLVPDTEVFNRNPVAMRLERKSVSLKRLQKEWLTISIG